MDIGSEAHFREALGPSAAALILEVLQTGTTEATDTTARLGCTEARTRPDIAYDVAKSALDAKLDQWQGVNRVTSKGLNLWVVDDTYALRLKQLGTGYRPRNHASKQQSSISSQGTLDGMPSLIHVTAGPHISPTTGLTIDYVIVKHTPSRTNKHAVEWVVDLQDLAQGGLAPSTPILPIPQAPANPAAIKRASSKRKNKQAGDAGG